MLLGARYPTSPAGEVDTGLSVFPNTVIAAHWNELDDAWRAIFLDLAGEGLLIGIDVDAALVGDGANWLVHGPGDVHIRGRAGWRRHSAGTHLQLQLTSPAGR